MTCGFDTPFSSSSVQVPSRSLLPLLTSAWPFLGLVSLSATIMLLKLASRLVRLYVSLMLLPFSDWNPISVAQGARRLLVAELLELFIWVVAYLRQLIALIAPHEAYDPRIVTTDLTPMTTIAAPIASQSIPTAPMDSPIAPMDSPVAPPRRPRPASYHGRTTKSGGIKPLHLPLKVAGSPRFNSDTALVSVDEDIPLPFQSRATSRSRRPSDASRPASAGNPQFSIDEDAPTRHRRSASSEAFLSQERASLLFRIGELEQALESARSSGEVMARTVLQITQEREELLHQSALLKTPDARVAELEDSNFNPQLVGGAPKVEHTPPATSGHPPSYPSPPRSPHSPLLFQPELPPPNHAAAANYDDSPSPSPRSSHLVKPLVHDAVQSHPRVMLISPTLDTAATAKDDSASGSLFLDTNAIGIFTSPIEGGDHLHPDHGF